MKGQLPKSQRSMKQPSLFKYTSPQEAGSSTKAESTPVKAKPKRPAPSTTTPRKSTQTRLPITPRSPTKLMKAYNISDSEDSSEDIGHIKLQTKASTSSSSSSSDSSSSSSGSPSSDEVPRPTQARRLEKLAAFLEDEDEDDEPFKRTQATASKRRKLRSAKSSDESSEEEVVPKRRRLTRARKTPAARRSGPADEDIDDLDQEHVLEDRLRERGKKSEFQKNLEKLKKRKLKQALSSDSEEGEDEEDEGSEGDARPFKGAKNTHGSLFGSEEEMDDGSDDFIIEDDGKVQLPAQFSMETHQDLQHQFKKIFQFFVHIAVQRPKSRKKFMEDNLKSQEYFSVPLQICRRKLDGLRDSLVASSVWRPEFTRALGKYPGLELVQLDFAVNGCDACHLGSRISTISGRLIGVPYDRMGFQPLKEREKEKKSSKRKPKKKWQKRNKVSSDSEEYNSESGADSDSSELNQKEEKKEFDLGRFCARRTQVYHEFMHWEYELFCAIDQEVADVRAQRAKKENKQFYRVAYAGGKQPPEDLDDADSLTDWLDERGIVERGWQRIRAIMSSARKLEIDGKKGGGDLDTS